MISIKKKGRNMGKKMEVLDFTKIFDSYRGKWVALTKIGNRVVGSGSSPKEALKTSLKKGISEPVFLKVPPTNRSFIL